MESLFDVGVQREPRGETARTRGLDDLLLIVDDVERESGADLAGIGEVETLHERKQAVGEKTIGSVPRVGTRLLGTELRVIDVEVEDLAAASMGADVRGGDHVAVSKGAACADLKPVIVILPCIGQRELPVQVGEVGEIVNEAVNATLPDVLHFQINVGRELAFKGEAFVQDARRLQGMQIGSKGRENRPADWKAVLVKELIDACSGTGTGDKKDRGRVVKDPESGGKLGVSAAVQDPGSGEAG